MIPVYEPSVGNEELKNVAECIKTAWISSMGKFIQQFESEFSKYCGVAYGVTTSSGTAALHLAVETLGLKRGDEVIVPAFTMVSTLFAIIYAGAKPVLVDSERDTWNIDTNKVEERITRNTKAILPVHIYGHPVDMDPIRDIAEDHDLYIVEDAAEAHGAEYKGRKCGSLSDIACFSFYANKIVTTGEGGMVVTDNEGFYERAQYLKNLAFSKKIRFLHKDIGFNYRMTNLQAAIGVAQLSRVEETIRKRRSIAHKYNELLKDVDGITLPVEKEWAKNVYWMYAIVVEDEFGVSRDEVMNRLMEGGIETRSFFIPMHQQPVFQKMGLFKGERYPVAEEISKKGMYLPSGLTLTGEQIEFICGKIKELGVA